MGEKIRVLLIEDDQVDRMAFARMVREQSLDYEYAMVTCLEAARAELAASEFDVVVADYRLPDGTASELFGWQLEAPIVVTTGAGGEEIAVEAMRAGAYNYMIKDTRRNYLKMLPITLESALRKYRADRELKMLSHAVKRINESVFICDLEGRVIYVNEAFCRTYGYKRDDILGQFRDVLFHEPPPIVDFIETGDIGGQFEARHRHRSGRIFPVLQSCSLLPNRRGEPMAEVFVVWDITHRKRAEVALKESEERYALAARGANDGLWDWNLKTNHVYFSPRWKSMLGYDDGDIGCELEDWLRLVHADDSELLRSQLQAHVEGRTSQFENEHRLQCKDGSFRWMLCRGLAVRQDGSLAHRMAGSQTDITERKTAEQRLRYEALHDALTSLPNRNLFLSRLESAVRQLKRRQAYAFAVLFLDLDRFKVINDSLGHLIGDRLLNAVARRLEVCLREGDMVARLGGDEFAILLDDLSHVREAEMVAERILAELQRPFSLVGQEVYSDVSIGITLGANQGVEGADRLPDYERAEEVLRDADTAMYRAKASGQRLPVLFDPTMHAHALGQLRLENDLRRAVEIGEFELCFQPIFELQSCRLWGFEALIRWRHVERGLLYPKDFLPLAEETGLMERLGAWVLRSACQQVHDWRQRFAHVKDLAISVNIAAQQLASDAFPSLLGEVLAATRLPPGSLYLEISEAVLMDDPETVHANLCRLRECGVQLLIDDFGTGYSSLTLLPRFPLHGLKIDQSFVHGAAVDKEQLEVLRTMLALADNLSLAVFAEGIESTDQRQLLEQQGCRFGQGFLFAHPLSAADAAQRLSETQPSQGIGTLVAGGLGSV